MKILILTPQLPYPPHQGTSLRNYHIIRGLAQRHELTLLSFLENNQQDEAGSIGPLKALCWEIVTVPVPPRSSRLRFSQLVTTRKPDMAHRLHSDRFNIELRRLLARDKFDIVQIEGIELARAIEAVRLVSPGSRIIFDDHNAETELQRRAMQVDWSNPRRWAAAGYSRVQIMRLAQFESWACENADWVTAVSDLDRASLLVLVPDLQTPITVIPNCLDVQQYQASAAPDPAFCFDLLFSGKMDYRPNVDAVLWFADYVWPEIMAERPSTTWVIVGQKPHPRLERLKELKGVTITGWVEKIQPYLAGTAVPIMPFRVGSGTRLKLIEAMAAGKAIVSTTMGAEGFAVTHQKELIIADTPQEMKTAVLRLLNQPKERLRLGAAAQKLAIQYDWRVVIPRFDEIYHQLATKKRQ